MADLSESESLCTLRSLVGASSISVIMNRVRGARASRSSRCTVIARALPAGPAPPPPPLPAAPTASSAGARHPRPTLSTSLAPSSTVAARSPQPVHHTLLTRHCRFFYQTPTTVSNSATSEYTSPCMLNLRWFHRSRDLCTRFRIFQLRPE